MSAIRAKRFRETEEGDSKPKRFEFSIDSLPKASALPVPNPSFFKDIVSRAAAYLGFGLMEVDQSDPKRVTLPCIRDFSEFSLYMQREYKNPLDVEVEIDFGNWEGLELTQEHINLALYYFPKMKIQENFFDKAEFNLALEPGDFFN